MVVENFVFEIVYYFRNKCFEFIELCDEMSENLET